MNRLIEPPAQVGSVLGVITAAFLLAFLHPGAAAAQEATASFTIPTTVPCLLLPDGTVTGPSGWKISNTSKTAQLRITGMVTTDAAPNTSFELLDVGNPRVVGSFRDTDGASEESVVEDLSIEADSSLEIAWRIGKIRADKHRELLERLQEGEATFATVVFSIEVMDKGQEDEGNAEDKPIEAIDATCSSDNGASRKASDSVAAPGQKPAEPQTGGATKDAKTAGAASTRTEPVSQPNGQGSKNESTAEDTGTVPNPEKPAPAKPSADQREPTPPSTPKRDDPSVPDTADTPSFEGFFDFEAWYESIIRGAAPTDPAIEQEQRE